jgi:hypothetical protein
MSIFPKFLSSQFAYDIGQFILDGFKLHYRIFRNQMDQVIFYDLFSYPQHLRFIIIDLPSSDERIST